MKQLRNFACLFVLFLSLFMIEVLFEPVYALGDLRKSRLSSSHFRTHHSTIGPSFSKSREVGARSMSRSGSQMRTRSAQLGNSILKKRVFKNRHRLLQSPFLFIPITTEPAASMTVDLIEDDRSEASPEDEARSFPLPSPLIIEERCGEYIQIPWPDSGVLYEQGQETTCPEAD